MAKIQSLSHAINLWVCIYGSAGQRGAYTPKKLDLNGQNRATPELKKENNHHGYIQSWKCNFFYQKGTDAVYDAVMVAFPWFRHIEIETKFDTSKKGIKHHLSEIRIHDGVADDDVTDKLRTVDGSPPTVALFKEEGHYTGAYITGDEVTITCYSDCLMVDILQLLAVYYIFDLDYPYAYAMFLGLLQQFVIEERFTNVFKTN